MTDYVPVTHAPSTRPRLVSVVVIGRNEGERLVRCLQSIAAMQTDDFAVETIYVDSASTDGSPQRASASGARVIEVRPERPSAAIGRNAGWNAASGEFVLFLDGDTQLHPQFVRRALKEMRKPDVAIVWGHRREARPEQSVYVRVLDLDWIYAPGPSEFCGGDALVRRCALQAVDGFDDTLIAGIVLLAAAFVIARSMRRNAWKAQSRRTRLLYALHSHLQQIPILFGQLSYHLGTLMGRRHDLVDYKQART